MSPQQVSRLQLPGISHRLVCRLLSFNSFILLPAPLLVKTLFLFCLQPIFVCHIRQKKKSARYTSSKLIPQHVVSVFAKSGSSNISRNFSASECSMFYSPSRCSGLSSSTHRSTASNFKLPSVCMMSDYSVDNFQNRRLGTTSRLRGLKHTDYAILKAPKNSLLKRMVPADPACWHLKKSIRICDQHARQAL